jgi:hypothetical protein
VCSKHVENLNKCIRTRFVCQGGYLQDLNRVALSTEHKILLTPVIQMSNEKVINHDDDRINRL